MLKKNICLSVVIFTPETQLATFSASYSHDRLEADLPGEVALQISLKLLQLSWVVYVMERGVVEDAAC